jgi:hypothetical protein
LNLIVIFNNIVIQPIFLLDLISNLIENYYETDKYLIKVDNNHVEYENRIKPRTLIFQMFVNLFYGDYIQFNLIQEINLNLLQKLFKFIIEMLLSINVEDFLAHISKANIVYSVIKIIFNKYIEIASLNKDEDFDTVIKYLEEGIDCLDNVCIVITHNIVILYI